jgi:hypothetical protein
MATVRYFRPINRLALAIEESGGRVATQLVADAERALEELRSECGAEFDTKIAAMDAKIGMLSQAYDPTIIGDIYSLANQIFSEAGVFGAVELSSAARSLCALTSDYANARVDINILTLHVEAMKALRMASADTDAEVRTAVLNGLNELTRKSISGRV